jgi:hypothetical protein
MIAKSPMQNPAIRNAVPRINIALAWPISNWSGAEIFPRDQQTPEALGALQKAEIEFLCRFPAPALRPASLWIVGEWVLRFGLMVETRFAFAAASGIRRRSATWTILLD